VSRRVLVVAYYFPPLGGVGVQRTLKYVKYLPDNGWQPVVLTPAKPAYTFRDETLLDRLAPNLQVERTASFEPARLPNAVAARLSRRRAGSASGAADATSGPAGSGMPARILSKGMGLWKGFWGALLFPDEAAGWIGPAVRRGIAVHKATPLDLVYSTSPTISGHVIAGRIASRTGLPWVADFRDPWIGNAFGKPPRGFRGWRQRRLERKIVSGADLVIFATPGLLDAYSGRYPWAAGKMRVIPNGYDRADLPAPGDPAADRAADRAAGPPFRLIYTGSIFGERELALFLEGLDLLVRRRPEVRSELAVEFVGWMNAHNRAIAAAYTSSESIGPMLRFSGFMPRVEAMRRAVAADALLTIVGDEPRKSEVQGGKLMEYLGYDRPILAVIPEGQAREVLRELDWGIVADPNPESVAAGLDKLLASPPSNRRADPEGRYDRVNLTARLAGYFDEVVAARPLTLAFIGDPNSVHTRRWIGFFAERGHRVHLLVPNTVGVEAGLDPRITVHIYRAWPRTHVRGLGSLITGLGLKRLLGRIKPDVLHAHYLSWYGWSAWLSGFHPCVITVWGSDVFVGPRESPMHRRWGRRTLSNADMVTAVSEDLAREAIELGARPEVTRIVQFGFDPAVFAPAPPPAALRAAYDLAGHRVVLSPRGLTPLYRHEVAIAALARLPDDVVLLLVKWQARPEYLATLEGAIRERGLESRIRWVPPIAHDQMADHYRLADVVVSLATTDAFSVTALESMACGVPVVMADVPSAHEGLGGVDPTAIVPGDDPEAVAAAILARLSVAPAARAELGAKLRAAAIERGDVNRNLGGMEDAYRRLAAGESLG